MHVEMFLRKKNIVRLESSNTICVRTLIVAFEDSNRMMFLTCTSCSLRIANTSRMPQSSSTEAWLRDFVVHT